MTATATAAETDERPAVGRPRILVSIEPRSYGEVIGTAIQCLRPYVDVGIVEPDGLMFEVAYSDPVLVICSRPRAPEADGEWPAWFEYRPYESPAARISIDGHCAEMEEVELSDLVLVVDDCLAAAAAG